MRETGFYAQKSRSPTGFILVVLLHVAVLSALIMMKGTTFTRIVHPPTIVNMIEADPDPDPIPPPDPQRRQAQQPSTIPPVVPVVDTSLPGSVVDTTPHLPVLPLPPGPIYVEPVHPDPPPVRREAEIDPAYRGALQPPYPSVEQRQNHDGDVRVRVRIGANGRVIAIEKLSASSDAFWVVTEHQALTRWRFRPATLDGRPVESTKVMNLQFRIQDA